jgi:MFS family permease
MILGGWVIAIVLDSPPMVLPVFGELYAWQTVFIFVGLPGLLIALLMGTVREPVRQDKISVTKSTGEVTEEISIRETIRFLAHRWRTYGSHFLGLSVVTIIGYAFLFWIPTMFIRTWNWTIPQISLAYGLVNLIVGPLGVILGGWLADLLYRRGRKDAHMRVCFYAAFLFVPGAILVPLMPSPELAIVVLIPTSLGAAAVTATGVAALMMITPNQLRAQTTALYYFVINVLGLSVGAAAVGLITDYVFADESALRYTLSIISFAAGLAGLGFLWINLGFYRGAVIEAENS